MISVKFAQKKISLLESDSCLLTYEKDNIKINLSCKCTNSEKTEDLLNWAFSLVEQNVKHMYMSCEWGWKPKQKISEINAKWARYLVASVNNEPIGFSMFRFDMENGYSVLYCYELQVTKKYQALGLGTHMMKVLEYIALTQKMQKVMLTVFKSNKNAYNFYVKLGYIIDDISPTDEDEEPYYILSKCKKHINSKNMSAQLK